jgi:hypothetical protein
MKNEFTVTKQEMLSWVKRYIFTGAVNKILFALYLLLGLVGVSSLLTVISNDGDKFSGAIGIASVIISVYKLFFERRVFMLRRYNLYAKTYGVDEWQRIIEFTDDDIVLSDHTSISRFRYENIRKIINEPDTVILVFNGNAALRFYKNAFVEGTFDECMEKIESKMK